MAWYSLLPSHLTTYETWIVRAFLILAIINLAPWVIAILYDILYYIARQVWHEVPVWGGRARGERRPRAPTLRDRTRPRGLAEMIGAGAGAEKEKEKEKEKETEEIEKKTERDGEGDGEDGGTI